MSQAEQVPEDMPAYLNHEPVGTGKPLASHTQCFLSTKSSFSGHVAHFGAVEMGNMKNEDSDIDYPSNTPIIQQPGLVIAVLMVFCKVKD